MATIQRITIESQLAQIGVRSTPARLHVNHRRPQMTITSERSEAEIQRGAASSFRSNRRRQHAELGAGVSAEMLRYSREAGRQGFARGTRAMGPEGSATAEAQRSGNRASPSAQSSAATSAASRQRQLGIGLAPSSQTRIVWDTADVSINWTRHSVLIDWDGEFMPEFTVDPKHSVEVFLLTEPYFRVSVEEMVVAGMLGLYIDQEI